MLTEGTEIAKWFSRIYDEHFEKLLRYSYSILGDKSAAEDVVSEVFTNIWVKRDQIMEVKGILPYLIKSVRNHSLKKIKEHHFFQTVITEDDIKLENSTDPELILLGNELEEIITGIVEHLTPNGRLVFEMARNKGYKKERIANELGISVRAVNKHLNNVLNQFNRSLESRYIGSSEKGFLA